MLDLDLLRQEIAARNFKWKPADTRLLTAVTDGGTNAFLGVMVKPEVAAAQITLAAAMPAAKYTTMPPPPKKVDWRSFNGKNFVTPVRNQGACGSCVSFATVASIESRIAIQENKPNPTLDLSEAHLYFCAGRKCEDGWWPELAMDAARTKGVALEKSFPYQDQDCPCLEPPPSPVVAVTGWDTPKLHLHRKQAIAYNGPVVAVLEVHEDFMTYGSGVYRYTSGELLGLHAVAVVGYDDAKAAWLVKNSWGAGWGQSGFGMVGYGDSLIDTKYLFWDPLVSQHAAKFITATPTLVAPGAKPRAAARTTR